MVERNIPHNIDAEENLLGSLLIDDEAMRKIVNTVKPTDFYSERLGNIYSSCLNLYSNREKINQITVAQELAQSNKLENIGGAAFLAHLISVCATSLDVEYYAGIVYRLSVARHMIAISEQISGIGYSVNGNIEKSILEASDVWDEFKKSSMVSTKIVSPKMAGNDILNLIEKYSEPCHFPSWGFASLDAITAGIAPEYIIFGARTSVGKTQLIVDIADNLSAQKKHVLIASAEMQKDQLYERRISRNIGVSILQLRKFGLNPEQQGKLADLAGEVSESTIHYFSGALSLKDIYKEAFMLKQKGTLDMLFIDYIGALSDCLTENRDSQATRISRVSNKIQSMVHEFNVPVFVAAQLNRELEKTQTTGFKGPVKTRRPQLSDLRDSGSLEQDADVVFLGHRELEENGEMSNVLRLKMAKNRQLGPAKSVELAYNHRILRYTDVSNREEGE